MAGFGSVSLVQTAVGMLLDQRAIVLYKQPEDDIEPHWLVKKLWGGAFTYEELFSGLLGGMGVLSSVANVTGMNPYGITYIDAKVNIESDLCDHPVENGSLITDASIILPVTATVTVAMPTLYAEKIYEQMNTFFETKKDKIILQTKYNVYKNLVLQNIEYELETKTIDRAQFILTLREIQEAKSTSDLDDLADSVADASDATTQNIGSQVVVGGIF